MLAALKDLDPDLLGIVGIVMVVVGVMGMVLIKSHWPK